MILFFILIFCTAGLSLRDLLSNVPCDNDPVGYIIPDPLYCNRYLDCDPVSGRNVRLCPDGQVLQIHSGLCERISDVDCQNRQIWHQQVPRKVSVKKLPTHGGARQVIRPSLGNQVGSEDISTRTVGRESLDVSKLNLGGIRNVEQLSAPGDPLTTVTCEQSKTGYLIHDPNQCDRYMECTPHGVKSLKLCPDGLALSLEKGVCDFIVKVDCSDRPKLQPPRGKGHCIRENGKFPLPPSISCNQYVDCRGGEAHVQGCAVGAVYDEKLGCVHPDETERKGCSADDRYDFQCPHFGLQQRFGDHDRLPHPTDCKLYYACLRNGLPRQASCQQPLVFNPETGFCDDQNNVPGCAGYYTEEETLDSFDKEALASKIRDQILQEFGLSSRSRLKRSTFRTASSYSSSTVPFEAPSEVKVKDLEINKTGEANLRPRVFRHTESIKREPVIKDRVRRSLLF